MNKKWFLYNQRTEMRYENIEFAEAIKRIHESKLILTEWLAWREGMTDWAKASDILEFQASLTSKMELTPIPQKIPRPVVPHKKIILEQENQILRIHEQEASVSKPERRKHQRLKLKFKIIISCNSKTFRSFTKDISLGGVLLQDPIPPEMQNETCEIFISNSKGNKSVKFSCRVVSDPKKFGRISFQDTVFVQELERWLKDAKINFKKAA